MKVLLDEDLPHMLRLHLGHHDVSTVAYMGWNGLKNGELLRTAESAGFEVFLTADKALSSQQNLKALKLGTVALSAQDWPIIRHHLAAIIRTIDSSTPGSLQFVPSAKLPDAMQD